jgi:hypothetical protein
MRIIWKNLLKHPSTQPTTTTKLAEAIGEVPFLVPEKGPATDEQCDPYRVVEDVMGSWPGSYSPETKQRLSGMLSEDAKVAIENALRHAVKQLLDEPQNCAIHTLVYPTVIYQDGQQVHQMTSVLIERGSKGCIAFISTGPIDFINEEMALAREAWGKPERRKERLKLESWNTKPGVHLPRQEERPS